MNIRPRLLISECIGFSAVAQADLEKVFLVSMADLKRSELIDVLPNFEVLWVRLRNQIDREVIDAGENLKVIATNTTGLNHIDENYARTRDIQVISLRGEYEFLSDIRATAELCLGLIINLLRKISPAARKVLEGAWSRECFLGRDIYQKEVGIIGYGRLGRIIAQYMKALGARVSIHSKGLNAGDLVDGFVVKDFSTILRDSDIVTLHVDFQPGNERMFGAKQFEMMKKSAVFINTSRGELVDQTALLFALESGQISGAAVDVLCDEINDVLGRERMISFARESERLLLTPHIGGFSIDSLHRTEEFLAKKLTSLFS